MERVGYGGGGSKTLKVVLVKKKEEVEDQTHWRWRWWNRDLEEGSGEGGCESVEGGRGGGESAALTLEEVVGEMMKKD